MSSVKLDEVVNEGHVAEALLKLKDICGILNEVWDILYSKVGDHVKMEIFDAELVSSGATYPIMHVVLKGKRKVKVCDTEKLYVGIIEIREVDVDAVMLVLSAENGCYVMLYNGNKRILDVRLDISRMREMTEAVAAMIFISCNVDLVKELLRKAEEEAKGMLEAWRKIIDKLKTLAALMQIVK